MKINKKLSAAITLSLMLGVYGNASAEDQVYLTGIDSSTPGTVQIKDCLGNTIDIVTTAGSVTKYVEGESTTAHSFTVSAGKWTDVKGSDIDRYSPETAISSGNSVTIAGTAMVDSVYGGYAYKAGVTVENNTVTIKDSATTYQMFTTKGSICGGFSLGAHPDSTDAPSVVKNNVVSIEGVNLDANAKGASIGAGSSKDKFKGDVTGNTVTIKNVGENRALLTGYATGGTTRTGNAEGNIVKITSSAVEGTAVGGNVNDEGNVISNQVIIEDGTVGDYVQGGFTEKGNATSNTVSITDGAVGTNNTDTGFVYGGYVNNEGNVQLNKVNIAGYSVIYNSVYGGFNNSSNNNWKTENNEVNITGNSRVNGNAYGAYVANGDVTNNKVVISGGKVDNSVYGGRALDGNATNNTVKITSGTIGHDVNSYIYGGYTNNGAAAGNTIEIDGATTSITAKVIGGWSHKGTAGGADVTDGNTVTIKNGYVRYGVTGGEVDTGIVQNNNVIIEGGSSGSVYGGSIKLGINAAPGNAAIDNKVQVKGGTVRSDVYGGYLTMGSDVIDREADRFKGNVKGNEVVISNDKSNPSINGSVYGGYTAKGNAGGAGENEGNTVTISAGSISGDVYGGKVGYFDKSAIKSYGEGDAVGNIVSINGGTTEATKVKIGYIDSYDDIVAGGYVYGGQSENGEANGNKVGYWNSTSGKLEAATNVRAKVVIGGEGTTGVANNEVYLGTGVKVDYDVYGGKLCDGVEGEVYAAQGNIVTIDSNAAVEYDVYGGYVSADVGNAIRNTVNISGNSDIDGSVYGGRIGDYSAGNANYNIVNVSGGKMTAVEGGFTINGNAVENHVNVTGGKMLWVTGGFAGGSSTATENNIVDISGTTTVVDYGVEGGVIWYGKAINNEAIVTGGTIGTDVFGGEVTDQGDATGNKVTVSGGFIGYDSSGNPKSDAGNVYGGYTKKGTAGITQNADGSTSGAGNTVSITGGTIGGNVYGGESEDGDANGNSVTISGGEIGGEVCGGKSVSGDVNKNVVEMNGANIGKTSRGGRAENGSANENIIRVTNSTTGDSVTGGNSVNATADKNVAEITDSTIKGNVFGAWSKTGAQENQVSISGNSNIYHDVYGGYALEGNVASNSVTISGGEIGNSSKFVYGGYTAEGKATSNTVTITDGTISSIVIGGKDDSVAGSEKVTDGNKVIITGGTVNNAVYGGSSANNNALNNSVEIDGSTTKITGNVYGGSSWGSAGIAKSNEVNVKNGTLNKDVYGGFSGAYNVEENTVNVSGGTISGNVYGGYSNNGDATSNTVTLSGGTINGIVYGGKAEKGTANNNKVGTAENVAANFTSGSIYGGRAATGAKGNEVHIGEGAAVKGIVYGSYSNDGIVESNLVSINGSSDKKVQVDSFVYGGDTVYGTSKGNKVGSEDNVATNFTALYVYGGRGETGAEGNEVYLGEGVVVSKEVYGGRAGSGAAKDNKVYITADANVSNADVYGGASATSSGNTLNIDTWSGKAMKSINDFQVINVNETRDINVGDADGLVDGEVVLTITDTALDMSTLAKGTEIVYLKKTAGNDDFSSKFKEESSLNGYKVNEGLWRADTTGGFGVEASKVEFQIDAEKAFVGVTKDLLTGKLLDEAGAPVAEQDLVLDTGAAAYAEIYGAYNAKGDETDAIVNMNVNNADLSSSTIYGNNATGKGTTLNAYATGVKVKALQNFENMNFYIPVTAKAGDTMVEVGTDVDLTEVNVAAGFHNDNKLNYGDKVKLINATAVSGMTGVSKQKVAETDYTKYDVLIYQGDDGMKQVTDNATSLVAELTNTELSENAKSLVETISAGTSLLADGSDMLASTGFENAAAAVRAEMEAGAPAGSMSIFGAIGGNKAKVKSGSHIDTNGWNFNLGLAKELKNKSGKLLIAPVVEYGRGNYDSYLNNGYHAEGNVHFVGGGLMAKQLKKDGVYVEGSVRAGKLSSKYKSHGGNYDADSAYLAAHLGVGKVVKLNAKNSVDYYGKYFYSHQASDDTTVHASGKPLAFHFDGVDSHRTRLGGRLNHYMGSKDALYVGFAWQHEFNSTARATLDGMGIAAPSLKGDTGIMELGWKLSQVDSYDLDLGATGSIGKKKGAGLKLNFNWKF